MKQQDIMSWEDVPLDVAAETTCMNCHCKCSGGCTKSPEFRAQAELFIEAEKRLGRSMSAACGIKAQALAALQS